MEGIMPIRIKHRDKNIASTQLPDNAPIRPKPMLHLLASYTVIEAVRGMLYGSI